MFEQVKFDERGLVPCVAQDADSGEVLTLAYANEESLQLTRRDRGAALLQPLARGDLAQRRRVRVTFLKLRQLRIDCDGDAVAGAGRADRAGLPHRRAVLLLPRARAASRPSRSPHEALATLQRTLRSRAAERPEGSYTVKLLDDPKLIGEKVEEEAEEVVRAAREESDERVAEEAADLLYHLSVLLASREVPQAAVMEVLNGRRG